MTTSFQHPITVHSNDIDELGHVNNVVYIRWVQEVAAAHWRHVGSRELIEKYSWVVLRHEIDYITPCFLDDRIMGSTWVGEHHGAKFERFVQLLRVKDNKVLAEAKTI